VLSENDGAARTYKLDRNFEIKINISIPAKSHTWLVIR
jgi:hypothetical protein